MMYQMIQEDEDVHILGKEERKNAEHSFTFYEMHTYKQWVKMKDVHGYKK